MSREKWFNPEDKSQCVIRPDLQDKTASHLPPNLLVIFSQNLLENFVTPNVLYRDSDLLQFFGGESILYKSDSNRNLVAIEGTISAPIGVSAIQTAVSRGVKRVFVLGLCGAVDSSLNVGDFILPTLCEREEGTSFHYIPPNAAASPNYDMLQSLTKHLEKHNLPYRAGKTVSTDAPYRQTIETELTWRKDGILGVDMEMSAVFALCKYLKIPSVGLFVVSDTHDLTEKTDWEWNKKLFEENFDKAFTLLMQLTTHF